MKWKQIAAKVASESSSPEKEMATRLIRIMAGIEPGKWWDVILLGKKTADNPDGRYWLGKIEGEKWRAIARSQKKWPWAVGQMILER